jgi:hypothetical protein
VFFEHCQRVLERLKVFLGGVNIAAREYLQPRNSLTLLSHDTSSAGDMSLCHLKIGLFHRGCLNWVSRPAQGATKSDRLVAATFWDDRHCQHPSLDHPAIANKRPYSGASAGFAFVAGPLSIGIGQISYQLLRVVYLVDAPSGQQGEAHRCDPRPQPTSTSVLRFVRAPFG